MAIRTICAQQWTIGSSLMRAIEGLCGPETLDVGGNKEGYLDWGGRKIPLCLRYSGLRRAAGILVIQEVRTRKAGFIQGREGEDVLLVPSDLPRELTRVFAELLIPVLADGIREDSADPLNALLDERWQDGDTNLPDGPSHR